MTLSGGVRLWLVDPSDPSEDLVLDTDAAEVVCEAGEPVRFSTLGARRTLATAGGRRDGRGPRPRPRSQGGDLAPRTRRDRLASRAREGQDASRSPSRFRRAGPSSSLPSASARPRDRRTRRGCFDSLPGQARLGGGVTLRQGTSEARSSQALLTLAKGKVAASTTVLEGDVS
jgi:hypothetical protein